MEPDLTPDAFARLSALEQSQELLRRAQFLYDSSQRRHTQALDRYHADLTRHAAMHAEHTRRMASLEDLLRRQQQLEAQVLALAGRLADRQDQQAARQDDQGQANWHVSNDHQVALESKRALSRETGWFPWIPCRASDLDHSPYAHRQVTIVREEWTTPYVVDPLTLDPQTNVVGLWWRPAQDDAHA